MPKSTIDRLLCSFRSVLWVRCDDHWTIHQANPGFAGFVGLAPEQLMGRSFLALLTVNAKNELLASAASAAAEKSSLLLHLSTKDGHLDSARFFLETPEGMWTLIGEPLLEEEARFQHEMVALNNQLVDLTRENARKKRQLALALKELKEAQSMLVHQEKLASLGQMTAGIAHEINNPISFVLSNQVTLERDFEDLLSWLAVVDGIKGGLGDARPDLLSTLTEKEDSLDIPYLKESIPRKLEANLEGLRRVKQLVLDLRTFSRLDEAEMKSADLGEDIRKCIQFLDPLLKERGVAVETVFEDVPEAFSAHAALNQVFGNILSNAVSASRPGATVRIHLSANAGEHEIVFEDEGEGIPEENLSKIFDPFFTTKPVGAGTGLGLSIAHQIIEHHHGAIEVESRVGAGTRMTIRLPFAEADTEPHGKQRGE